MECFGGPMGFAYCLWGKLAGRQYETAATHCGGRLKLEICHG